jgi:hypothetical protein
LSIRQLSLLRSQMKADLAIYGLPFVGTLSQQDVRFLREAKAVGRWGWRLVLARLHVPFWSRPWTGVVPLRPGTERCGCPQEARATGTWCRAFKADGDQHGG